MSAPDPSLSQREQEIFFQALGKKDAEERAAFLDGACANDPALRPRLEALLAPHFESATVIQAAAATVIVPVTEKAGDRIGRYKLLQPIGEGGFGTVYIAEQEEPVRRRVALKVIKVGMDTKEIIARFEQERQALALMDHPNIARILDGGATATGRPYFVMELVKGVRITEYCDEHKLSTRQRLELFAQVCQAIQHAHQKGIIHRDIKPSNILVTVQDGVAVPKVIDFGIAKATGQQLTDKTVFTQLDQFMGTPAYMSPEQVAMGAADIDPRTDIYSLGVLLYQLLTGKTPFDAKELLQAGFDEMRRKIREDEPPKPSTRLNTLAEEDQTTVATHRQTDTRKLGSLLRGDLDWIVMKALEKDRTRRYATASGLADDLKRHLNTEPVIAGPPSLGYKLKKAVRRNKLTITVTAMISFALALVPWQANWQRIKFLAPDWQARIGSKTPLDNRLVLIGIDTLAFPTPFSDEELQREPVLKHLQNPFPWSRAVWARLIEKLSDAGAKVIVLDLVLASRTDSDDALHQALERYQDRVVIGYNINARNQQLHLPSPSVLTPADTNSTVEDDRLGYVNFWPDSDGTLRRASFRQAGAQVGSFVPKDAILESLEARALRKFGRPDLIPPGFDARLFRHTAPANPAFKPESLGDVLSPKLWEKKYDNGKVFQDKIVLLGPTAEAFANYHITPFMDRMVGPEIHLQIINAALHGEVLGECSPAASLFIIALSVLMAGAVCFLVRRRGKRLLILVGLSAGYAVFAQLLFEYAGQVIPLTVPLLVLVVSSFIVLARGLVFEWPGRKI